MTIHIILGSTSDEELARKVVETLKKFGVSYRVSVASAHRAPEKLEKLVKNSNADVFICIAGLSAALPGVVASRTLKPVIGVPKSGKISIDSLLSISQMPPGVPVACVGIDSTRNAALLALRILAIKDENIEKKLEEYRMELMKKGYIEDLSL